jgi:hypothetical protein
MVMRMRQGTHLVSSSIATNTHWVSISGESLSNSATTFEFSNIFEYLRIGPIY